MSLYNSSQLFSFQVANMISAGLSLIGASAMGKSTSPPAERNISIYHMLQSSAVFLFASLTLLTSASCRNVNLTNPGAPPSPYTFSDLHHLLKTMASKQQS